MRRLLVFLLIFAFSNSFAEGKVEKDPEALPEAIDFSEPPFWMFTYDEFSDLQPFQKKYYIEKALPAIRKIEGMEDLASARWMEASEWYKTWDAIAKQVYVACRTKKLESRCRDLASIRKEALKLK